MLQFLGIFALKHISHIKQTSKQKQFHHKQDEKHISMRKGFIGISAALFASLAITSCGNKQTDTTESKEPEAKTTQAVEANGYEFPTTDTTWKTLTLREKIGQTMMMVSMYEQHRAIGGGSIEGFLKKYPVGGMFIAKWYYNNGDRADNDVPYMDRMHATMKEYNEGSRFPMFFSEDFERGLGETHQGYTQMPAEMSIGAANDLELAYNFGQSVAKESKEVGINWLLHPVADLNMNPHQSLVIERAVSDDADRALPLLKKQVAGIQESNVISTVKHFPGDGTTMHNQHLTTSANTLSMEEWNNSFRKVFQGLINDGAASIMTGHIQFPAYQTDSVKGMLLPGTLSKQLLTDLLKGELDFKGVIISDALNMGGSSGYYDSELETAVECFKAGVDVVLWPSVEYMDTVEARILRGEIPMERLDDAVQRIWSIREQFNLINKKDEVFTQLTEADKKLVQTTGTKIGEKAITLIEDKNSELPLDTSKVKTILLASISHADKTHLYKTLKEELEKRGFEVEISDDFHFHKWGWRINHFDKYDKVIVCFENKYFDPLGSSFMKDQEAYKIWTINMLRPEHRIAISFSNPYYVDYYESKVPLRINAYSSDAFTQKAIAKALCGEIKFEGTTPVKLKHDILK